jgi:hypothetical protein
MHICKSAQNVSVQHTTSRAPGQNTNTFRPQRTLALRAVYSLSKPDRQACRLQCFLLTADCNKDDYQLCRVLWEPEWLT